MARSTAFDPYQPPTAVLEEAAENTQGLWSNHTGRYLIVERRFSAFPERCVKCDQPTQYRLKRRLYWLNPWVYLLIFLPSIGLIALIVVGLIVRKKETITVGVCEKHRVIRRNATIFGWTMGLLGCSSIFLAVQEIHHAILITIISLALISIIFCLNISRIIFARKITEDYILLGGVSKAFISRFPVRDKLR